MRKYKSFRIWNGKISFLVDRIAWTKISIFIGIALIVFIFSIGLGDYPLTPIEVIQTLFGEGSNMDELVVYHFRLPRAIISLLVGSALAVAGAILQGMIRNPLASPDILGVTGGASVFVVAFLTIFSNEDNALTVSISWLPLAAFLGATVIAYFVYLLSWKKGVSPIRLVLIGIGISALAQALTTLLMILGPIYRASQANIWITGSVNGSDWGDVTILTPWIGILLMISLFFARKVNIQELGDDIAKGVGGKVQLERFLLLTISTALVGGAVAFAGGIGFVGLIAPHIARRIVGSAYGVLIPLSAVIGGILVMTSDLLGRTLFLPLEVPAGVFTAAIGAPYFIYLLFKAKSA
ncbi:iron ABC transporter permease [Caldifermentibacillus hisashii]|uniref:FecCD family ABC transporter permease n=1 Tax=Caldifermentibacillus hisashii TaxID=996558 RepID=UPI0031B6C74D